MDGIRDDHGNHDFSKLEKRGQITSSLFFILPFSFSLTRVLQYEDDIFPRAP